MWDFFYLFIMGNKMLEQENKMIQDIIDNFDFRKCEVVMKALDWTWGFDRGVPTIKMLEQSAIERLRSAMELAKQEKRPNTTYFSSSGGLKANAWINRYGHIEGVRLEFVLTEWDSDGDV
jgi:hypothetical protein